jgi:hypothetical protein
VGYDVEIRRYWLSWILCWHGRKDRRLEYASNGVTAYCKTCGMKRAAISDFGSDAGR